VFIGPILSREVAVSARRPRMVVLRAAYPAALLLVVATAWLVYTGPRIVRGAGDVAEFGTLVFQLLAAMQLALALFFSALFTAGSVAQEKDRGTLEMLLMTELSNRELVLGKLLASLFQIGLMALAGLPIFMLLPLLGGVAYREIAQVFLLTAAAILAAGSVGATIGFRRENTFQILATTFLALLLWLLVCEGAARAAAPGGVFGVAPGEWAAVFSPWHALPYALHAGSGATIIALHVGAMLALAAALNLLAIARLRVWYPPRGVRPATRTTKTADDGARNNDARNGGAANVADTRHATARSTNRAVWDNPIAWREIRTRAYGRRLGVLRAAYVALAVLVAVAVFRADDARAGSPAAYLAPLFVASLMLVNALAVTGITSERDRQALDLLLVSDLAPRQIVFGKLAGALYNAREMVAAPIVLAVALAVAGRATWEHAAYLGGGLLLLDGFVAVLGLHCGMIYTNTRTAIVASLGTLFALWIGVATCIALLVAFSGPLGPSFEMQLAPFLALMIGGGAGLYYVLAARHPSTALAWAVLLCPFATFWAITSYFLDYSLGIFLVTAAAYGFTTLAMLVPAVAEFDAIVGRTTGVEA
jgi:ABC-type transport system involved in multi-copper enzyme maturation permease subunit